MVDRENWQVLQASETSDLAVTPSRTYGLRNTTIDQFLGYGERTFGINLVWRGNTNPKNIRLTRGVEHDNPSASDHRAIKYREPIAIKVRSGSYLRYGQRDFGINLKWSDTPIREWEIRGGDEGEPVKNLSVVSLYNRTIGDEVVYCTRDFGIDLKWHNDCTVDTEPGADHTAVIITMRINLGIDPPDEGCEGSVRWELTPLELTGSDGISTRIVREVLETAEPQLAIPGEGWVCDFKEVFTMLRRGTWQFKVQSGFWTGQCTADLVSRVGFHQVNFTMGQSGCKPGGGFPGDD